MDPSSQPSAAQARVGQQAVQKKGNWKEFEQSQSRPPRDKGLFSYRILLPEMSRWGHCGFIFSISGKNLIWLPQSFPSPQLQACSIACFSVGEQRIGNGLSFFFFISHSSYDTHRGRKGTGQWELQMWNFFFKSPLLLLDVWQAVEIQQCNSRRCCEAEAEQAFFFDRDPPVKLSSNSPAQTLPGCTTGLVSNGQCDAKPGQGTEHFGWVTLLGNEDFCGEKPQQALPSP